MGYQDEIRGAVKWDLATIDIEGNLRALIRKLIEANVSSLAVKLDDAVVGVVTESDVLRALVAKKDPDATVIGAIMSPCELITGEHKSSPCIQLHQSEPVENALKLMEVAGINSLLVSGDDDKQVGMVSVRDLLRLL
jgi:CBS domain-containing protein